jgi:hypothetical protein
MALSLKSVKSTLGVENSDGAKIDKFDDVG